MARRIHFSRLLDIISGSALAGANTKVQKSALNKDFDIAKLESKKLRELIDSNLPTFYVVDIDTIVFTLSQGLGLNNFKENQEYIEAKFPSKSELVQFLHDTLTNTLNKLPKKPFMDTVTKLNKQYETLLDTLAKRTSYVGYRNAATKFGAELRGTLKSSGVYIASDGAALVSNLGSNKYVIIGPTFNSAVEKVNSLINEQLRLAFAKSYDISLKPYSTDAANRFTIGDFVNAGHTAAYTGTGDLIGINMPLIQERQFLLSGDPKSAGLETAIADLYLTADYAVEFNQQYTSTAKTLLDMQFSFVVTMPQKYNTSTLRTQEVARVKQYIGKTVLPDIIEQARKKFAGGVLSEVLPNTSASPTLLEFIEQSIISVLKNKSAPVLNKKSKASTTKREAIGINAIVKDKTKKIVIKQKSGGTRIKRINFAQTSVTNLPRLLDIINSKLHEAIKSNMGEGNSRNTLNYRTGRLAKSAKVERLTESRAGMITAFYTYMKNPYATFSQGGRQSTPASRDPKLLISKSIREIAGQQVANRMRAVAI